jgi:hypothetical protein
MRLNYLCSNRVWRLFLLNIVEAFLSCVGGASDFSFGIHNGLMGNYS